MPIVRRRCALCDDPLPDTNPTNTCIRCQEQEARDQPVSPPVVRAKPAPPMRGSTWDGKVQEIDRHQLAICPRCERPILVRTNICHPGNPMWPDCRLGLANAMHVHHFCPCGVELVSVHPPERVTT